MKCTILLTTDNPIYKNAVNEALKFNCTIKIGVVDKDIPQLVGYKSARICCKSMIKSAIKKYKMDDIDWIITIEDYLSNHKKVWWSTPLILITDANGNLLAQSPPWKCKDPFSTLIPEDVIKATKKDSSHYIYGWTKTIGETICEKYDVCKNDWQSHYNDREQTDIIKDALDKTIDILEDRIYLKETIKIWDNKIYDIYSLLSNKKSLRILVDLLCLWIPKGTTKIIGLESNLALATSSKRKLGYIPMCISGKLSGPVIRDEDDICEIRKDSIGKKDSVVIISDIISDTFPPVSAVRLVQKCNAKISHFIVVNNISEYTDDLLENFLGIPFTSLFH